MDADEDDMAIRQFMRIKIRLDIRKPLMSGVTIDLGEGNAEKPIWCPLCYEFLPIFRYTCDIIGHTDRLCEKRKIEGLMGDRPVGQSSLQPWRVSRGRGSGAVLVAGKAEDDGGVMHLAGGKKGRVIDGGRKRGGRTKRSPAR